MSMTGKDIVAALNLASSIGTASVTHTAEEIDVMIQTINDAEVAKDKLLAMMGEAAKTIEPVMGYVNLDLEIGSTNLEIIYSRPDGMYCKEPTVVSGWISESGNVIEESVRATILK